jgi:hypothetical protein
MGVNEGEMGRRSCGMGVTTAEEPSEPVPVVGPGIELKRGVSVCSAAYRLPI